MKRAMPLLLLFSVACAWKPKVAADDRFIADPGLLVKPKGDLVMLVMAFRG